MKIGLLVPNSQLFPLVGLQFCDGVMLALQANPQLKIELVIEDVGNATNTELIKSKSNKLLLQDRVDAVIAYVGAKNNEELTDLFDKHKKILVLAEMGAFARYENIDSTYVHRYSLREWAASYALGKYLASQGFSKAFICLSMMDAGYQLPYSFVSAFESAGGKAVGYMSAQLKFNDSFFEQLDNRINESQPDILYCAFSGKDAIDFFNGAMKLIEKYKLQVAGPALLTIAEVVEKHPDSLHGIITSSAWYPSLQSEINEKFCRDFKMLNDNEADRFALLGYECALYILNNVVQQADGRLSQKETAEKMRSCNLLTPRGGINCNHAQSLSGSYIAKVSSSDISEVIHFVDDDQEDWRLANFNNHPNEGWLNPYPCT